jgi:DNA-binding transcriptional MerR regulator
MSTRNIRAHQTRGLLQPPVRAGRTAYYDARHLRRLMNIQSLQEQGFNLVAIEAVFAGTGGAGIDGSGVESGGVGADALDRVLDRIDADRPDLMAALCRLVVVRRAADGAIRPIRFRLLRAALDLDRAGLSAALSLQVLVEVLDLLRPVVDELGQATSARIVALRHRSGLPTEPTAGQVDRDDAGCIGGWPTC